MSLVYDPNLVKEWANNVVGCLNGGAESVSSCSKKFSQQIEELVKPDVWTGSAAWQNYHNFLDTHKALITFINSFGNAFQEAMNSVAKNIAELEVSNLGIDTNVASAFGTLSYDQLNDLSEENINKELVTYNYNAISEIGESLKQINSQLETVVNEKLKTEINKLNDGSKVWDGDAAQGAKDSLLNTLTTNMQKVTECLQVCINNISSAAKEAQAADGN